MESKVNKINKNYVIEPKTQDSAEFYQYLENVAFQYSRQIEKLIEVKETLQELCYEMDTMPKDGLFDIKKFSNEIFKNSLNVNIVYSEVHKTGIDLDSKRDKK
tara:strand:+ start:2119 stop:2427 length:309 start_codon:yes stop_codon:yes gene_type:complete